MLDNNTPYVSHVDTKDSYCELNLDKDNIDNEKLKIAIEIFKNRMDGRFWDSIGLLRNNLNNDKGLQRYAFAITAIDTLLIETFAQFRDGRDTTESPNKEKYAKFLVEEFPQEFCNQTRAEKFYSWIRCGILHQAQTKNLSGLTYGKDYVIGYENGYLLVSVDRLTDLLHAWYERYCERLEDTSEDDLRKNFVQKMDYICERN